MITCSSSVTIKGCRPIAQFLSPNICEPFEPIIHPNVELIFNPRNKRLKSTASFKGYVHTFTYNNKFSILESPDMVQIIFEGNIIIDQSIIVEGKTLTLISFNGCVTIKPDVILIADTINIFAKNGSIQNEGTLDTSSINGNINLFAQDIQQGTVIYNLGSLLINSTLTQVALPTPNCADQFAFLGIVLSNLVYSLNGITQPPLSLTTGAITNFPGGYIAVDTTDKVITVVYNGIISMTNSLDFSFGVGDYSITIITPCDFNVLTNSLISGANLTMLVGGNLISGSLVTTQNGGKITITVGGNVEVQGHGEENTGGDNVFGGWAGIGGKGGDAVSPGTSVGSITLTVGQDLTIRGGDTHSTAFNYGGAGSAIGAGGGGGVGTTGNGQDGGSTELISIIAGGKIAVSGGLASSSFDQESGGASGIGGGGAGGTQGLGFHGGKGGDAFGNITLICGNDAAISGSNVANTGTPQFTFTDGSAGSGIGGGGAGGNHLTGGQGNNGGGMVGNVALTVIGKLTINGGSTSSTATGNSSGGGSGIGGGGGSYQDGTSNPITGDITVFSKDEMNVIGGNTTGSGVFNDAGGASGIGGGGGGGTSNGSGGNGGNGDSGFIQLISYLDLYVTGGTANALNTAVNSAGNGASIGGGGGGGSDGSSQGGVGGNAGDGALLIAFGIVKLTQENSGTGKDGKVAKPQIVIFP